MSKHTSVISNVQVGSPSSLCEFRVFDYKSPVLNGNPNLLFSCQNLSAKPSMHLELLRSPRRDKVLEEGQFFCGARDRILKGLAHRIFSGAAGVPSYQLYIVGPQQSGTFVISNKFLDQGIIHLGK